MGGGGNIDKERSELYNPRRKRKPFDIFGYGCC